MFVFVKYYPDYWCVFDMARSEVSLKAAHSQRGVRHRPRGGVIFGDRAGGTVRDKQIRARHRNPVGTSNPETGAAFTTAPAVVYSPIWPGRIVTKKRSCGACCADRERCEQDGEQTAPPVLAQPLQCFPPAKLRCDVSANYDKDGSGCADRLYAQPQSSQR